MSGTGTAAPSSATQSTLLNTIIADLHAGESWLVNEAETDGLAIWNAIKAAFIAIGPAAGKLLMGSLEIAVADAAAGDSIEQIEQAALNTATDGAKSAIKTAGSAATQQLIIGIRANQIA